MPGPLPTACLPLERLTPRALYVHLPFCARRCPYCDFATAPLDAAREARYLGALELELRARAPTGFRPWTVYLGGGTPTELTTPGIERLVELLRPYVADAREVTVEANPRTLLARKLLRLRELGVDRVSLGAQSFAPELLETLGRFHRAVDVARAVEVVREAGVRSLSLDLIFAVPGQGPRELRADLEQLLAFGPDHVSVYCLTVEAETEFHRQRARGELREQSSTRQARLFDLARRTLRAAGFEHYEVSSFARRGHRSRHNRVYWRNLPYLGVGNGAASHLQGERSHNARDVDDYVARVHASGEATVERERLDPEAKLKETVYLALRTSEGLVRAGFQRATGVDAWEAFEDELGRLESLGLLRRSPRRAWLSGRGVSLADAIAREFL
ncbi:MAG: radical SAM family heme chaperone HemW [Planctomycetes bacterium]|nr:radical SAM family heme chaperone HemW [Planctomycetota bacterium]